MRTIVGINADSICYSTRKLIRATGNRESASSLLKESCVITSLPLIIIELQRSRPFSLALFPVAAPVPWIQVLGRSKFQQTNSALLLSGAQQGNAIRSAHKLHH